MNLRKPAENITELRARLTTPMKNSDVVLESLANRMNDIAQAVDVVLAQLQGQGWEAL